MLKVFQRKMENIKSLVKKNKENEIKEEIKELDKQNYITKDHLLKQYAVKNIINETVLKIVGDQMIEYEEEIEEKQCLIDEYQAIIGDDKLNNEILEKSNKKYIQQIDPSKLKYKEKVANRLIKKLNNIVKQLK